MPGKKMKMRQWGAKWKRKRGKEKEEKEKGESDFFVNIMHIAHFC